MNIPPYLSEGDLVAIVSPSSFIADSSIVEGAERTLQSWGLRTVVMPHALLHVGHFAASDDDRLADLQECINNPEVKAILCSRGGYGAMRLLHRLNFSPLKTNPKWIIGFSDITALHFAAVANGCCSLHSPMAKALAHSHSQKCVVHAIQNTLFGTKKISYKEKPNINNRLGSSCGRLIGGNLSLVYGMQGSPWNVNKIIDTFGNDGAILFVEDLCEKFYHIDRMMRNLMLSGALSKIKGLIVGQFTDINPDPEFGQTLEEIFLDVVKGYDIPVCFDFPVGHVGRNFPLIEGAKVQLDVCADKVTLKGL